jgi:hypothetical protein
MTFWHTTVLVLGAAGFVLALVVGAAAGSYLAQWSRRERSSPEA